MESPLQYTGSLAPITAQTDNQPQASDHERVAAALNTCTASCIATQIVTPTFASMEHALYSTALSQAVNLLHVGRSHLLQ